MIKNMEPKIVFEDEEVLVLEKPPGWVVNRAESVKRETVQEWVEKYLKVEKVEKVGEIEEGDFFRRAGMVHRLDKETSGLLLVAKTPEAFEDLQSQFKERKVEKKYLALVRGKIEPEEGEITAPVGRLPWNRERFGVFPGGREAKTRYRVISNWELGIGRYSLLELMPQTGRTHQIRVHLKYLGHPIVGDLLYGGRKMVKEERKWSPRMFLHAAWIKFRHPKTGKTMVFESNLPTDLKKVLNV